MCKNTALMGQSWQCRQVTVKFLVWISQSCWKSSKKRFFTLPPLSCILRKGIWRIETFEQSTSVAYKCVQCYITVATTKQHRKYPLSYFWWHGLCIFWYADQKWGALHNNINIKWVFCSFHNISDANDRLIQSLPSLRFINNLDAVV